MYMAEEDAKKTESVLFPFFVHTSLEFCSDACCSLLTFVVVGWVRRGVVE